MLRAIILAGILHWASVQSCIWCALCQNDCSLYLQVCCRDCRAGRGADGGHQAESVIVSHRLYTLWNQVAHLRFCCLLGVLTIAGSMMRRPTARTQVRAVRTCLSVGVCSDLRACVCACASACACACANVIADECLRSNDFRCAYL